MDGADTIECTAKRGDGRYTHRGAHFVFFGLLTTTGFRVYLVCAAVCCQTEAQPQPLAMNSEHFIYSKAAYLLPSGREASAANAQTQKSYGKTKIDSRLTLRGRNVCINAKPMKVKAVRYNGEVCKEYSNRIATRAGSLRNCPCLLFSPLLMKPAAGL